MYQVIIPKRIERQLDKLPKPVIKKVSQILLKLENNPWQPDSIKLLGYEQTWRININHLYRLYYDINEENKTILVLTIVMMKNPQIE